MISSTPFGRRQATRSRPPSLTNARSFLSVAGVTVALKPSTIASAAARRSSGSFASSTAFVVSERESATSPKYFANAFAVLSAVFVAEPPGITSTSTFSAGSAPAKQVVIRNKMLRKFFMPILYRIFMLPCGRDQQDPALGLKRTERCGIIP